MEKISALIDKLQELKNSNAGLQSISYYVQLLQAEILHARNKQKKEGQLNRESSHVAVIMPGTSALNDPAPSAISNGYPYHYTQAPAETPKQTPAPVSVQAAPAEQEHFNQQPVSQPPVEHLPYTQRPVVEPQPIAAQTPPVEEKPVEEVPQPLAQRPVPVPAPPPAPIPAEPEKKHAPAMITLFPQTETRAESNGVHKELKELNQRVAQNTTSLNERFRQGQVELADRLGEMPVKDLRHAIGINDKFQFIQELFRGDIDTYERSIKTINEFHSLQEAEYWIERELKIRQGWEDNNLIVKQFYALVRKRFT
jgi:outer membrane biosynthesis protein TonB